MTPPPKDQGKPSRVNLFGDSPRIYPQKPNEQQNFCTSQASSVCSWAAPLVSCQMSLRFTRTHLRTRQALSPESTSHMTGIQSKALSQNVFPTCQTKTCLFQLQEAGGTQTYTTTIRTTLELGLIRPSTKICLEMPDDNQIYSKSHEFLGCRLGRSHRSFSCVANVRV